MSPREPKSWPCRKCRATLRREDDTFDCKAKGCANGEQICVGCVYACEDCGDDFCFAHIVETPTHDRFAEFRCLPCQERRGLVKAA